MTEFTFLPTRVFTPRAASTRVFTPRMSTLNTRVFTPQIHGASFPESRVSSPLGIL